MFVIIERYINNLDISTLKTLAMKKNINLSDDELSFSYEFVKNNWKSILSNHGIFDIDKYKDNFSEENFIKIKNLIKESIIKYNKYL